mgnify:CR=1 FL=1
MVISPEKIKIGVKNSLISPSKNILRKREPLTNKLEMADKADFEFVTGMSK